MLGSTPEQTPRSRYRGGDDFYAADFGGMDYFLVNFGTFSNFLSEIVGIPLEDIGN